MPTIEISVREKVAREPTGCAYIVCNNTDYVVQFDFDVEWNAHSVKTARFIWNGQYRDIVFSGSECAAPAIDDASVVGIGVFAGELRTTTPAMIPCRRSILDGDGIPAPPTEDVYSQIMALLNDLETDKITPVDKTDEMTQEVGRDAAGKLYTKPGSGSGGTADHRQLEHRDAANQHPISAVEGLTDALAGKQPVGNYLTSETDPTVPAWAKQPSKPTYTASEVHALPDDTVIPDALADLADDATHRLVTDAEKTTWNAKYAKPSSGIPASDLASSAATTLVLQALTVDTDDWTAEQQQAAQERLGILSVEEVLF